MILKQIKYMVCDNIDLRIDFISDTILLNWKKLTIILPSRHPAFDEYCNMILIIDSR